MTKNTYKIKVFVKTSSGVHDMYFTAQFITSSSGFGNRTQLYIEGDDKPFDEIIDCRYDKTLNTIGRIAYIAHWATKRFATLQGIAIRSTER